MPVRGKIVTVADIAEILDTAPVGGSQVAGLAVGDIRDDSRTLAPGDAYVALGGERCHGMQFEREAARMGAVMIISDRPSTVLPSVVVDDPRGVIGPLCAWFHSTSTARVFGVTGTNGKTSTTHFVDAGLAAAGENSGLISGVKIRGPGCEVTPERTTPEATILHRTLGHFRRVGVTACAMEVSSHAVHQRRVDGIHYRVMGFTNLTPDHLDYHGAMEKYYETKASMFTRDRTDVAVVNIDDAYGRRLAATTDAELWTYGIRQRAADVRATNIACTSTGSSFDIHTPHGRARVGLQTLGPHQVDNAVAAITMLIADGIDLDAAVDGVSSLPGIAGRCEPVHAGQPFTAIVDYMHNTAGQRALMPYLRSLTEGRIILVAGATGGRDRGKRRPLGLYAGTHADIVIVTDESPEDEDPAAIRSEVLLGARQANHARCIDEPDRRAAIDLAVALAGPGDLVVLAGRGSDHIQRFGARSSHFDDHAQLFGAIKLKYDG